MASDLVLATWRGPFAAQSPTLGIIEPGDECLVTEGDLLSAHWEPVKAAKADKPTTRSTD